MLRSVRDHISRLWQGRFMYGAGFAFGGGGINRYDNGEWVFSFQGPSLHSPGTGHWPFFLFEIAVQTGPKANWHIGLLGHTAGKIKIHTVNEEGMVDGPDVNKYYFFFKGINNQGKQLEEIIVSCQQ